MDKITAALGTSRLAESIGSSHVDVGEDVDVLAFMAKHTTFGVHLIKLHALVIQHGAMRPSKPKKLNKKGLGSRKYRRSWRMM
jgi:hypothetical protein